MGSVEMFQSFEDLLLIDILFVEILGNNLDCLVHGITDLDCLDSACVVGKDGTEVESFWNELNLIMDTLSLNKKDERLDIVCTAEGELLLERLVAVRSEHDIDSLSLAREQYASLRHYLEPLTIF